MDKNKVLYHGITLGMVEEFLRDYMGTLKTKGLKNEYRSIRSIAEIMNLSIDRCHDFIVVASVYGYLWSDANTKVAAYINMPILYKVKEDK